jgi:hypothetical protein
MLGIKEDKRPVVFDVQNEKLWWHNNPVKKSSLPFFLFIFFKPALPQETPRARKREEERFFKASSSFKAKIC